MQRTRSGHDAGDETSVARGERKPGHASCSSGDPGLDPEDRIAPDDGLTSAQKRMWFLQTMNPDNSAYTIATAHQVSGPLSVAALRVALSTLAARHEMMRSSFPSRDGHPYRALGDAVDIGPEVVDLSDLPVSERSAAAAREIRRAATTAFDLAIAPLMRFGVVRLSDTEHVLTAVFHHIIADGWSLSLFHHELEQGYSAALDGRPLRFAGTPRPAADALREERAFLSSQHGRAALDWWTAYLGDAPMLELPMARSRPRVARFVGARHEALVTDDLVIRLEKTAQDARASLYMMLATAFAIVLHRYSGQTDLVFGSPAANRADPEAETSFGLYVNTIVLRVKVDPTYTVGDVLRCVRTATLGALQHQAVPFEKIVERLSPHRALSHTPVIQVMFALQSGTGTPLRLPGLTVKQLAAGEDVIRFDLEFSIWRTEEGLKLRLVRNVDILDAGSAKRFLTHFTRVLKACGGAQDRRVSAIEMLGPAEAADLSARERQVPPAGANDCLHRIFERQCALSPNAVAFSDAENELTFDELDWWATRLSGALISHGVAPRDVVGICTERSVALVVATLAVLKAGAAFLPLDPAEPVERRAFMLQDARVGVIVVSSQTRPSLAEAGAVLVDVTAAPTGAAPAPPVALASDLAYVIYTSGSTGQPKGVEIEHRNIVNTLCACRDRLGLGPADCGLVLAASTFDVFYYELFAPILSGGRARLLTREETLDPTRVVPLLQEATSFQAVPGLMQHLLAALATQGVERCPAMRRVMTGGDVVQPALLRTLHDVFPEATVCVTYGPTETAIFCTCYIAERDAAPSGHPIGVPLPGTAVRIGDAAGLPLPINVNGEIWIGGAGVGRGYLNRPNDTSARFVTLDGERFYRSGDRGRLTPEHGIEFLGRADRQVKVRGFRIELAEVETALEAAPGVARGLVVVDGADPSDQRLSAYVTPYEPSLARRAADLEERQIGGWRDLFETTYSSRRRHMAGENDFTGWNSTLTGEPLPIDHMEEWLNGTLQQILSRVPPGALRERSLRVLEIGCGTGLVLLNLADYCSRYAATDISPRVLADLRARLAERALDQVDLYEVDTDHLDVGVDFDVIIVNSVAQYLASSSRLGRLIDDLLGRLRPGGFVFLGDLRNLPLLETFHVALEAERVPEAPAADVLRRARDRMEAEQELVLHPQFFGPNLHNAKSVVLIEAEPRRGRLHNEMTRYRFDAVLHKRPVKARIVAADWRSWKAEDWSFERIRQALEAADGTPLALTGIPDARLVGDVRRYALLATTVGEADGERNAPEGEGVVVDDLRQLAEAKGFTLRLSCLRGCPLGTFDAYFTRSADAWPRWPTAPECTVLANEPNLAAARRGLAVDVADVLRRRLPEYMQPSSVTVLTAFPLSPNGKLDRAALPPPHAGSDRSFRPPTSDEERLVARAWDEVLGARQRSTDDDFFTSGGTSLRAVHVSGLLRAKGAPVSPQMIFDLRTIGHLAAAIAGRSAGAGVAPPIASAPTGGPDVRPAAAASLSGCDLVRDARKILLTGATGILGIHLLEEFAAMTSARIVCPVRAADDDAALARLREQYRWYFPDRSPAFPDRISVVAGDLGHTRLGLGEEDWLALACGCDLIVNAAADVRHAGRRDEILAVNRDGVAELVALARAGCPARLIHLSTLAVDGETGADVRQGALGGVKASSDPAVRCDPYSESKRLAESLVQGFLAAGGSGAILRVGTVAPHSETGRFQRNIDDHFFSRYMRALMELGVAHDQPDRGFGLIPVDLMARAVRLLCGSGEPSSVIFQLRNPHRLLHDRLITILRANGYPIEVLTHEAFKRAIAQIGQDPRWSAALGRLLPVVDGAEARTRAKYPDTSETEARLKALGFSYPIPSETWLVRFIAFGRTLGYFPPPSGRAGTASPEHHHE
ncbi:non-ribosomal peptide synthetase [Microvirga calopogonii]|uniref:non-ribosomal peptide synthetase n=1 Tax=Microvirga calopogonii TaxID=2078013 RepID=UPI000E0CC523|nr:non-ribosomal peptide synthetase [Microvirga calopogonii]